MLNMYVTAVTLGWMDFNQVPPHWKVQVAIELVKTGHWKLEDVPEEFREEVAKAFQEEDEPVELKEPAEE